MQLWYFMLLSSMLIPVIMLLAGWFMRKHCPSQINIALGYRTKYSMKNMDTWKFAHDYCGRLWFKIGGIMLLLSVLIMLFYYHSDTDKISSAGAVLMIVQCVILLASILPTEYALRKTFNKDGTRK